MKIKFWGVRGSYPVPGVQTNKFGGNTPCIEVRLDNGQLIIIDAGTGVRGLGLDLMENGFGKGQGKASILITHTHWDHIQGLPFFKPAFVSGNEFTIYARASHHENLKQVFAFQNNACYSPTPFADMKASMNFVETDAEQKFRVGDALVKTVKLNHPNTAIGYRIEADDKVFACITDTAPFEDVLIGDQFIPTPPKSVSAEDERLLAELQFKLNTVIENADLMVYDTFFQVNEYMKNPHWGHSTPEHGLDLCKECDVDRLALFHHAPSNTDEILESMQTHYRKTGGDLHVDVMVATEGQEVAL
ncbi:MAG: MBL fold metallo-hydrolase [Bacteroidetes bacterium]|nr:MBL fold metallo-hydrolase [Bacteroidota bacterium]